MMQEETMQEEQNVKIQIDTSVLKERGYANMAWADRYEVEILTAESGKVIEMIGAKKAQERIQLQNGMFLNEWDEELELTEHIQRRMNEIPLFTTKADYYSLNIKEESKSCSMGFLIFFFVILGLIGYLSAKYKAGKRKE